MSTTAQRQAPEPKKQRPRPQMPEPLFVSRETAAHTLSLSVSTFMNFVRKGLIAKPRLITPGRVGWRWSDLIEFADARPEADLPPPENTGNRKGKKAANDESTTS